ncbi:glutathione S-transferase family protein [Pseudohaliea rubra]|uniref:Maleylacetoacetate isomerase/ Glutathione S-transferase n=1 Tax=Pseudohaliea rubra DSM 19751 TaxID=1265313 RepID=A0A095VQA6_9GAMM|nr:glutathione S-transferase family protein [Pseudohaliea rubra]KGE03308.1 Maleylacetoacetate isomerase/ Glutathione S-transferase [Pseudohaliea rubra DSM 19751]
MLELYTHPMSPCAQKVRLVLHEKGLAWTSHHVELSQKENLRPEYLALNPLGVVPTLVDDGKPVIESSIICEYLEDAFPRPALRPTDPHARARMRFWMKQVDSRLHPACGALQWPLIMRPALLEKPVEEREALLAQVPEAPRRERQRRLLEHGLDAPDVSAAVATYCELIQAMDRALAEGEWVAGDQFSLADASLAPYFQTLHQFDWLDLFVTSDRITHWYERCRERESYREAVSRDFPTETLAQLRRDGQAARGQVAVHLPPASAQ